MNVTVAPSANAAAVVTFALPSSGTYDGFKLTVTVDGDVRETLEVGTTTTINDLESNKLYTFSVTSFVGVGGDEAESEPRSAELSLGMLRLAFPLCVCVCHWTVDTMLVNGLSKIP